MSAEKTVKQREKQFGVQKRSKRAVVSATQEDLWT